MKLRKILLLWAVVTVMAKSEADAQVFVSQNFDSVGNPGLPPGWMSSPATLWATGVPNTIMPNALGSLNYSLNSSTHTKAVGIDGTLAAADGALLTSPLFSIPASAANPILTFDVAYFGIQSNAMPPQTESLIFIMSTNGGATWTDVSFVAPVSHPPDTLWDTRSISMTAYTGQNNLKFGFRYNNQGGNLIGAALDNIKLINGADGAVIKAFAGDHPDPLTGIGYQLSGSNTPLYGTVQNVGSVPINSYYVKYKVGNGAVQSSSLISTPLAPLAFADFPAGLTVNIPASASYAVKAWIATAGDIDHSNDTFKATTVGVPSIPAKKPVFEEGTGTWCGWCPRGAVFMDSFAVHHPNGVASQIAVHNNDPMMLADYNNYMSSYVGGFPNLVIDRTIEKDPKNIDTAFSVAQHNFGFADVTIGAPIFSGNSVGIPVTIKPVVSITNPRLALVISESNVSGTGSNWPQTNYYSGGGSGLMGGWEDEAYHVDNVYFHFVARSITPSAGGGAANLPATLVSGTTYKDTLIATINTTDWKLNDLQYLVLFINGNNNTIMNSAFTALPNQKPALGNITAIAKVESDIQQAFLYPNPTAGNSYVMADIKEAGKATVTVTDIAGRTLISSTHEVHVGRNQIEVETSHLSEGSYLVNLGTAKANAAFKLQVVR